MAGVIRLTATFFISILNSHDIQNTGRRRPIKFTLEPTIGPSERERICKCQQRPLKQNMFQLINQNEKDMINETNPRRQWQPENAKPS